jgi:hypothetical protein
VPVEQIEQLGGDVRVVAESELPTEPMAAVLSDKEAEEERGDS